MSINSAEVEEPFSRSLSMKIRIEVVKRELHVSSIRFSLLSMKCQLMSHWGYQLTIWVYTLRRNMRWGSWRQTNKLNPERSWRWVVKLSLITYSKLIFPPVVARYWKKKKSVLKMPSLSFFDLTKVFSIIFKAFCFVLSVFVVSQIKQSKYLHLFRSEVVMKT